MCINYVFWQLKDYMIDCQIWVVINVGVFGVKLVVYFFVEFGIYELVLIYLGGFGVLLGDYIKSVSGLGVFLIGIGLFYGQGYFKQYFDDSGYQVEEYFDIKIENFFM